MGKKMRLFPSLFKNKEPQRSSWQWPSCNQPKTLSFRVGDDMVKTVNSIYFDTAEMVTTPESWFSNSSGSASFSTASEESGEDSLVIRGLRSERLFFEPGDTKSILEETKTDGFEFGFRFKESVLLAMESEDPYVDFRTSMEEMVEAHGSDWECLDELLSWYLKVNGKKTHGFIVGAFVDLLVCLASSSSLSSPTSPSLSSLQGDEEEEEKKEDFALSLEFD